MDAVGDHLDVEVLQIAGLHGAGVAAVAALGHRGHGAIEVRHQGIAVAEGLFANGAGGVGMGDGGDDAAALQFLAQPHRAFHFGRGADADDFGIGLQQRKIVLRQGKLQQRCVLRPRLGH